MRSGSPEVFRALHVIGSVIALCVQYWSTVGGGLPYLMSASAFEHFFVVQKGKGAHVRMLLFPHSVGI